MFCLAFEVIPSCVVKFFYETRNPLLLVLRPETLGGRDELAQSQGHRLQESGKQQKLTFIPGRGCPFISSARHPIGSQTASCCCGYLSLVFSPIPMALVSGHAPAGLRPALFKKPSHICALLAKGFLPAPWQALFLCKNLFLQHAFAHTYENSSFSSGLKMF